MNPISVFPGSLTSLGQRCRVTSGAIEGRAVPTKDCLPALPLAYAQSRAFELINGIADTEAFYNVQPGICVLISRCNTPFQSQIKIQLLEGTWVLPSVLEHFYLALHKQPAGHHSLNAVRPTILKRQGFSLFEYVEESDGLTLGHRLDVSHAENDGGLRHEVRSA
jgi:hypothetical protein